MRVKVTQSRGEKISLYELKKKKSIYLVCRRGGDRETHSLKVYVVIKHFHVNYDLKGFAN